MSEEENELVISLRMARDQFQRDIKATEKDIEGLKETIKSLSAEGKRFESKGEQLEAAGRGTAAKAYKDTGKLLDKEAVQGTKMLVLLEKQVKELKKKNMRMARYIALEKTGVKLNEDEIKALFKIKSFQEAIKKVVEKRVKQEKKLADGKKKEGEETKKGLFDQMRGYAILNQRGARFGAVMKGKMGMVLMAITAAVQGMAKFIAKGITDIREMERISLRMAVFKGEPGAGGGLGFTDYTQRWLTGERRQDFAGYGTAQEGATLEMLGLQSGLGFTEEQIDSIAISAKMAGEQSAEFMSKLVQWIHLFNIEKEDFDETIKMFGYFGGKTMGGTEAMMGQMDYVAGIARTGDWDPKQLMVVGETLRKEGRDTSRFWRGFRSVMDKVIEDDEALAVSIRGVDNELRGFHEILWILDQTMDNFNSETAATTWALEEFEPAGYEAIQALRDLVDDEHEYSEELRNVMDAYDEAKAAFGETKDILDNESLDASINRLQGAFNGLVDGLVLGLTPAIIGIADAVADFLSLEARPLTEEFYELNKANRAIFGAAAKREFVDEEEVPAGGDAVTEEDYHSPIVRVGSGVSRAPRVTKSVVTHNYITVMDNDAVIRGMLGVNLNVQ